MFTVSDDLLNETPDDKFTPGQLRDQHSDQVNNMRFNVFNPNMMLTEQRN